MAANDIIRIGESGPQVQHRRNNAWEVMKPFVHFGIKAISTIAQTLVSIVKHIPKPDSLKPPKSKDDKIIKL